MIYIYISIKLYYNECKNIKLIDHMSIEATELCVYLERLIVTSNCNTSDLMVPHLKMRPSERWVVYGPSIDTLKLCIDVFIGEIDVFYTITADVYISARKNNLNIFFLDRDPLFPKKSVIEILQWSYDRVQTTISFDDMVEKTLEAVLWNTEINLNFFSIADLTPMQIYQLNLACVLMHESQVIVCNGYGDTLSSIERGKWARVTESALEKSDKPFLYIEYSQNKGYVYDVYEYVIEIDADGSCIYIGEASLWTQ